MDKPKLHYGWIVILMGLLVLIGLAMSVRIVKQYERGVVFRLGRVIGSREPGLRLLIPIVDVLHDDLDLVPDALPKRSGGRCAENDLAAVADHSATGDRRDDLGIRSNPEQRHR